MRPTRAAHDSCNVHWACAWALPLTEAWKAVAILAGHSAAVVIELLRTRMAARTFLTVLFFAFLLQYSFSPSPFPPTRPRDCVCACMCAFYMFAAWRRAIFVGVRDEGRFGDFVRSELQRQAWSWGIGVRCEIKIACSEGHRRSGQQRHDVLGR